jgi:hypothetical protein
MKKLTRSERTHFNKMGKQLGVDPKSLPNMLWSEFNRLCSQKGLEPILAFNKKPVRTGKSKPQGRRKA